MDNLINKENLRERIEKYKIEDEKEKYIFRANLKYMISSSIFFVIIGIVAGYSLYSGINGSEKLTLIKLVLIAVLFGYILIAAFVLFSYKITVQDNEIIIKKLQIKMPDIEKATVKIGRISATRVDKVLEILTKDKKRIQIRLNIGNEILFFKLLQNQIGGKLEI